MPRKIKETKVEPLAPADKKAWDALIKETRAIVARQDHTQFELILLAGKVDGEYGQDKLGRWADEAGVSYDQAKYYRFLSHKGVDQAFIDKWCTTKGTRKALNYSVIRAISNYCGGLQGPYALEYLQWAVDHKATVIAIQGYMYQNDAPYEHKEEAHKAMKMALMDKQEHEGFSDFFRIELEKIAELKPELEEQILGTVITNDKDLMALKIAAGIIGQEELKLVEEAKRALDRLKKLRRWINQNSDGLTEVISYNHELSQELKHWCLMLSDNLKMLGDTPLTQYTTPPEDKVVDVTEIADSTVKRELKLLHTPMDDPIEVKEIKPAKRASRKKDKAPV